jgi:hypothetical protein
MASVSGCLCPVAKLFFRGAHEFWKLFFSGRLFHKNHNVHYPTSAKVKRPFIFKNRSLLVM